MPLICRTVITFVTQQVLEPVQQWVTQSQQQCHQYPWWDPRGWFCWIVTWVVQVIVWVVRYVVVPISTVVCYFVSFVFGGILLPFAAAIGPNAYNWVKETFLNSTRITVGKKVKNPAGLYDYHFTCNCPNLQTHPIVITIPEDDEKALALAKEECKKKC
jgi:hypothetical protein